MTDFPKGRKWISGKDEELEIDPEGEWQDFGKMLRALDYWEEFISPMSTEKVQNPTKLQVKPERFWKEKVAKNQGVTLPW